MSLHDSDHEGVVSSTFLRTVYVTLRGTIFLLPGVYLLSSDRLAQYCVNLSRWFTHETAAFCMEECTTPLLFS